MTDDVVFASRDQAPAKGQKDDGGKQQWYPMPLIVLQPLADAFAGGEKKYDTFNCLEPFDDPDRRFYDGIMRHLEKCQVDPLAVDEDLLQKHGIKVYHLACVAFNALMRLHHCRAEQEKTEGQKQHPNIMEPAIPLCSVCGHYDYGEVIYLHGNAHIRCTRCGNAATDGSLEQALERWSR